jgi:hypothetical protein
MERSSTDVFFMGDASPVSRARRPASRFHRHRAELFQAEPNAEKEPKTLELKMAQDGTTIAVFTDHQAAEAAIKKLADSTIPAPGQ